MKNVIVTVVIGIVNMTTMMARWVHVLFATHAQ